MPHQIASWLRNKQKVLAAGIAIALAWSRFCSTPDEDNSWNIDLDTVGVRTDWTRPSQLRNQDKLYWALTREAVFTADEYIMNQPLSQTHLDSFDSSDCL